jgi:hypothetical protein
MRDTGNVHHACAYRVQSGGHTRWFLERADAKQYANDRFDNECDGVPFVEGLSLIEVLSRLNELESDNHSFGF